MSEDTDFIDKRGCGLTLDEITRMSRGVEDVVVNWSIVVYRNTLLSADMNIISWFDRLESSDVLYWTEKA